MPSEPNRFLLAVGIAEYSAPWPPLPACEIELAQVVSLLVSETFGYQRILKAESLQPQREKLITALDDWCSSAERQPTDHLVVYWTGHGDVLEERLQLILRDTQRVRGGALPFDDLAGAILSDASKIGPVLFMLDVCFAGQGATDAGSRWGTWTRQRGTARAPEMGMICAAGARIEASPLNFANAFTEALSALVDPDRHSKKAIALSDIQAGMNARLGNQVRFPFSLTGHGDWAFFRNPHHVAHWPDNLDTASEAMMTHLENVGRGVPTIFSKGWHFKGRQRVFTDLCAWLRAGQHSRPCLVTGGLGAGKSAVLARLYTMSRHDYRCNAPSNTTDETELPEIGSIAGFILLQKKPVDAIFEEVCKRHGLRATAPNLVAAELERRGRLRPLVFDGLDEAERPQKVWDLLQLLAEAGMGIIVGVRSPAPIGNNADILTIDLNAQPWNDPGAISRYVTERLRSDVFTDSSPGASHSVDFETVQHAIVEHANGNFLLASLLVTAFAGQQRYQPNAQDWQFPATVGEAFDRIFGQMDEELEAACRDLLTPLAYAEGSGMPEGELWCALAACLSHRQYHLPDLERVMRKVPWFLQKDFAHGSPVFGLFHIALAEHLKKGRDAAEVHARIATILSGWSCEGSSHRHSHSDMAYAKNCLSAHLRRAGNWQELGKMVTTASWIEERNRNQLIFESAAFAVDLEHARQAAAEANSQMARQGQASPAVAETAWWLIWRSAQATLVERTPPAAWPLLVQHDDLTAGEALRLLANISHEERLACACVLLARSLTGKRLDDILDFAEGNTPQQLVSKPASVPLEGKPLPLFHEILKAALSGDDGARLTRRALNAAVRADDDERWFLLDAAMPHFSESELDEVEPLATSMRATIVSESGFLACASHAAACVAKGNLRRLDYVKNLERDCLSWWYASAALLALQKRTGTDLALGFSAAEELFRAESLIEDWYVRIRRMGALARALPPVLQHRERQALAVYLHCLRNCKTSNLVVAEAALTAGELASPHRDRLLRWARYRFLHPGTDGSSYLNLAHTPPQLARAFAKAGDLTSALEIAAYTPERTLYRSLAFSDVVADYYATQVAACQFLELEKLPTQLSDMHLQILCAHAALPGQAKQLSLDRLRHGLQLAIASDIRSIRCTVTAQLARHATSQDIYALVQRFETLAPSPEHRQHFALNCAAAGLAEEAVDMLRTTGLLLEESWARALIAAPTLTRIRMLAALDNQASFVRSAIPYGALMQALGDMSQDADEDLLDALCAFSARYRAERTTRWADTEPLLNQLAVRAFELHREELLNQLLLQRQCGPELLLAASRLPLAQRVEFVQLVETTCAAPADSDLGHFSFLAELLNRDLANDSVAQEVVQSIRTDSAQAHYVLLDPELADLFDSNAREDLLDFLIRSSIQDLDLGRGTLRWALNWMLPRSQPDHLRTLASKASALDNDYERERAVIEILPYYARQIGYAEALQQRNTLGRQDSQGSGWAALWPVMPEQERSKIFRYLLPIKKRYSGTESAALRDIAATLTLAQLIEATRWIIAQHRNDDNNLLQPFVQAALLYSSAEATEVWDAILAESARLPCVNAMSWLESALPLAYHLGGTAALTGIHALLEKTAAQWPCSG